MKENTILSHAPSRWSWVTLCGPDARDFLHRLTSADVKRLEIGQGTPACFLTAQGRIRAYFQLWRHGPEDFSLEFDPGERSEWKTSLLNAIEELTFGEKFTVTDVTPLASRWLFAPPGLESDLLNRLGAPGLPANTSLATEEEVRICNHGALDYGRTWLTVWGRPERLEQSLARGLGDVPTADPSLLDLWRIRSLRPRAGHELTDSVMPLEIGLTDAIAQQKGCYPGQEVIERILSMGSPPQRLALIEGRGPAPREGTAVLNPASPAAEIGKLTSVSPMADKNSDGFVGLAVLRKLGAKEGLEVELAGQKARIVQVARAAPNE